MSSLRKQLLVSLLTNGGLYVLSTVPLFWIFWLGIRGDKPRFAPVIQPRAGLSPRQVRRDLGHSAQTIALLVALDGLLWWLQSRGLTAIYFDPSRHGWLWLGLSGPLLLLVDDTFVYFTHRAMHHPRLFRFFHRVHHESTNPTPFTSLAFQPAEALVQNVLFYALPFVLPLHGAVVIGWQLVSVLNNVCAHLGHEVYPAGWTTWRILRHKTTSIHHNLHHEHFTGNFGLYFTWWDRWLGTELPGYEARHRALFVRPAVAEQPLVEPVCQVTILPSDPSLASSQIFPARWDQPLLESARAAGVALPYGCRRGVCGRCELIGVSGRAWRPHDAEGGAPLAAPQRIRTCQARPCSHSLTLQRL